MIKKLILCFGLFTFFDLSFLYGQNSEIEKNFSQADSIKRLEILEAIEKSLCSHPFTSLGVEDEKYLALLCQALQDADGSVRSRSALVFENLEKNRKPGSLIAYYLWKVADPEGKTMKKEEEIPDSKEADSKEADPDYARDAKYYGDKMALNPKNLGRYLAIETLGEIAFSSNSDRLIKMLDDPDPYIQGIAASALGKMHECNACDKLTDILRDKSRYRYARVFAAEALARIDGKKNIHPLLEAMKDEEEMIRYAACQAIYIMASDNNAPGEEVSEKLMELFSDSSEYVRSMAAKALGTILRRLPNEKMLASLQSLKQKQCIAGAAAILALKESYPATLEKEKMPDISMKIEGHQIIFAHKSAEYILHIENHNQAVAHNVKVIWNIPYFYMEYVSSNPKGKLWGKEKVVWNLGDIPGNSRHTLALTLHSHSRGGRFTHLVKLVSDEKEMEAYEYSTVLWCGPAVHISTYDTEDPVMVGERTVYVIDIRNEGTSECTNVRLTTKTSKEMMVLSAEGTSSYKIDQNKVVFDIIPKLAPGEKFTYKVLCKAISEGSAKNIAILKYDQFPKAIMDEEGTSVYK